MFPATLDSASVHVTGQIMFVLSVNVHNLLFCLSSLIVNVNRARRNKGRRPTPKGVIGGLARVESSTPLVLLRSRK